MKLIQKYKKIVLAVLIALLPIVTYTQTPVPHNVVSTLHTSEFKGYAQMGAQLGLAVGGLYGAGVGLSSFWTNPQVIALAGGPAASLYAMLSLAPVSAFVAAGSKAAWFAFIGLCVGPFAGILGGAAAYAGKKLAPLVFTNKHAPLAGAVTAGVVVSSSCGIPVWLGALHALGTELWARYEIRKQGIIS